MDIGLWGKLMAGVVLGCGALWLIWRKLSQGEARAVEIAGRQAQQQVEAEADAAEKAICAAANEKAKVNGPVKQDEWRFALLIGALGLLVSVSGCTDIKSIGVSRWPVIVVPDPLEYSEDERAALMEFSSRNPELARKIVNQSQAMRSAIDTYNEKAWEVNTKQLKTLGYTDAEIVRLNGPKPKRD